MADGAMVLKPAAVAAALCLMMVASGVWHHADEKPTMLMDDRDIFIKAQAAQQMQDYVNAFGDGKAAKKVPAQKHATPDLAVPVVKHAHKDSKLLSHWNAINNLVFPKKWAHAKPAHHQSRAQQEKQEMARIRHVNAETIPAARKHMALSKPSSAAELKHFNRIFASTFPDGHAAEKYSSPTSQTELAHLKDLNDAIFPKEEADSTKHWTATKQGLLAHYKELSNAAFPSEHFSHHAPLSGAEELANYKKLSESVNPGEKHARKHRRSSRATSHDELAHLRALSSRVVPSEEGSSGSQQTARDSEAAELAGFRAVNDNVFPQLKRARSSHAQSSKEELASLHKLSERVVPVEHAGKPHHRQNAQEELAAGMRMIAGGEFKGKHLGRRMKAGRMGAATERGVKGVSVGSKLHSEERGHGVHPWRRRAPVEGVHGEAEKRNVV